MSTNTLIRTGLIATLGVSALSISVLTNAQTNSRYGNVGAYESGHCQQPCAVAPPVQQAPVYIQQQQQPAPAVVYTQPAPVYAQQARVYAQPSQTLPGTCPVGTTAQPNGTCLQASYDNSYNTQSTVQSYSTQAAPVDCPAGTTAQSNGTCLQSGSSGYTSSSSSSYGTDSNYSSSSSSAYSSGTTNYSGETAACPTGSTAQADGTCLQTGDLSFGSTASSYGSGSNSYQGSTVDLYTGDASATTGYQAPATQGSANDYLPVRK